MPYRCEIGVIVQEGLKTCYNNIMYYFNLVIEQEGLLFYYIK